MATNCNGQMTKEAFEIVNRAGTGRFLITCDHASNAVPDWVNGGALGLAPEDMQRHIAYDIGCAGVTRRLSQLLDSPAILSRFSRLVVDPNRGEDDPTLVTQLYDGTIVPGNRHITQAELEERLDRLYRPYHDTIDQLMAPDLIYVAVHSFTPRLSGRSPRPWHMTVLSADDKRFTAPLLAEMEADPDIHTAENEPYVGNLRGDSVHQHALSIGALNALIEIRQDLIETETGQRHWAQKLATCLTAAVGKLPL